MTQVQTKKGEVKIPENVFYSVDYTGKGVFVEKKHWEFLLERLKKGWRIASTADIIREEWGDEDISFEVLSFFLSTAIRHADGEEFDFPIPEWMKMVAVQVENAKLELRDRMYEAQNQHALVKKNRMAFEFLLRQSGDLMSLPAPGESKNPKSPLPTKGKRPMILVHDIDNQVDATRALIKGNPPKEEENNDD